jgi:hypothetical protein
VVGAKDSASGFFVGAVEESTNLGIPDESVHEMCVNVNVNMSETCVSFAEACETETGNENRGHHGEDQIDGA